MALTAVPGKCGRGWWLLFCGKSLKTQRGFYLAFPKEKMGSKISPWKVPYQVMKNSWPFQPIGQTGHQQPLSSGHVSFHHPKKVTSSIARYRFFFPFVFKSRSPTQPTPWDVLATRNAVWRMKDLVGKSLFWLPRSNLVPFFVGWRGVVDVFFFLWSYSNPRMSKVSLGHFFFGGCKMLRVRIFESRIHTEHCLWGLGYEENLPPIIYQQSTNSSIGTMGWGVCNQVNLNKNRIQILPPVGGWTSVRWLGSRKSKC